MINWRKALLLVLSFSTGKNVWNFLGIWQLKKGQKWANSCLIKCNTSVLYFPAASLKDFVQPSTITVFIENMTISSCPWSLLFPLFPFLNKSPNYLFIPLAEWKMKVINNNHSSMILFILLLIYSVIMFYYIIIITN